jgi:hypothetical protein
LGNIPEFPEGTEEENKTLSEDKSVKFQVIIHVLIFILNVIAEIGFYLHVNV